MATEREQRIFQVSQVSKSYTGRVALAPISFEVRATESIAVVGPSGSGKTTLLHLLAGVVQPDEGSIALNGFRLATLKPGRELSSLVGVIHQQYDLVPHLSVMHNVLAGRLGRWGLLRSLVSLGWPQDGWIAARALERVGLADRLHERASRLSGGEQQRVAIARLLVQDPRIIIADEPVASLDPTRAKDLLRLLAQIARESEKTLIASIHSVELARQFFDRLIGLRNGMLEFDLPVDAVTSAMFTELYELEGLEGEGVGED